MKSNTRLMLWLGVIAISYGGPRAIAQGYVLTDAVTPAQALGAGGAHVLQNPVTLDYTGFFYSPMGGQSFQFFVLLDEGVRVFAVHQDDPISLPSIQTGAYPEFSSPNQYTIPEEQPFLVGLYTGYNPWIIINGTPVYTGVYSDPVYGWAELVNNAGTIELLRSGVAFEANGILAGTFTLIPEPSTAALLALGALCWAVRRYRE